MITIQDTRMVYHRRGMQEVRFEIANQDTSQTNLQYYGYLSAEGAWIVQKIAMSTGWIFSYAAGQKIADYAAMWNGSGVFVGAPTFKRFDQISVI